MSRRMWGLSFVTVMALVVVLGCATTALAAGKTVSKPVLSAAPVMGVAFKATGTTTPRAKSGVKVVVKLSLLMADSNGVYKPMHAPMAAKVTKRAGGYGYSLSITIPMTGKHALQALRYDNGKLVGKSAIRKFNVTEASQSVSIVATSHADVTAAAGVPLTIVFSDIGVGCGRNIHFQKASLFTKTSADPLTYETTGLVAGSYAWECSMGPLCHGGMLVVK